jgi:hypothetical protein
MAKGLDRHDIIRTISSVFAGQMLDLTQQSTSSADANQPYFAAPGAQARNGMKKSRPFCLRDGTADGRFPLARVQRTPNALLCPDPQYGLARLAPCGRRGELIAGRLRPFRSLIDETDIGRRFEFIADEMRDLDASRNGRQCHAHGACGSRALVPGP